MKIASAAITANAEKMANAAVRTAKVTIQKKKLRQRNKNIVAAAKNNIQARIKSGVKKTPLFYCRFDNMLYNKHKFINKPWKK